MSDGIKLGQLLCDADIITKRQLSKALAEQVKGRKGTIGEILVDMGFCSIDDITDAMLNHNSDTTKHEEKHEEIHQEPIVKEELKPTPVVEQPKKKESIELSEDKVLDTKFTLSIQTMIAAGTGLASLIGMWYTLQGEIEEAKELPKPVVSEKEAEFKDKLIRSQIDLTQQNLNHEVSHPIVFEQHF